MRWRQRQLVEHYLRANPFNIFLAPLSFCIINLRLQFYLLPLQCLSCFLQCFSLASNMNHTWYSTTRIVNNSVQLLYILVLYYMYHTQIWHNNLYLMARILAQLIVFTCNDAVHCLMVAAADTHVLHYTVLWWCCVSSSNTITLL